MDARHAQRVEGVADVAAAAALAAAVAFAAAAAIGSSPAIVAAAGAAFFLPLLGLRQVGGGDPTFAVAPFVLGGLPREEYDELLLTEADRLEAPHSPDISEELVLDDVLGELREDSRVVRLFDASAMPTPGQLRARIDRHLGQATGASPDASAALHEALAELRRSLN